MSQLTGSVVTYPARTSFVWYLGLILTGAMLLMLPLSQNVEREPWSLVDALFTSTSAACVTGLTVRSTGNDLSWFGQFVILMLMQLGGIGIMTVTTYLTFGLGGQRSLRRRAIVTETLGAGDQTDLRWLLRNVILLTLGFEALGTIILTLRNLVDYPLPVALWHALFHSVAAFCNAGFAIPDDNLIGYQGDWLVCTTIMTLIVVGGLGFPVLLDLRRSWRKGRRRFWERLQLHSKLMLIGTGVLLVAGTAAILVLESRAMLRDMPLDRQILVAVFQSVVPRTAGFNTVAIGSLTEPTLFVLIVLMFIGAGPCSTAGGFKVSTLMTLVARSWSTFRGRRRIHLFRRQIPAETVERSAIIALLFSVGATLAVTSLLVLEQRGQSRNSADDLFLDATFETASALGTVGLSTGLTTRLSDPSRLILIMLMFIGRLGPISLVVALSAGERLQPFDYPEERPLIG